MGHVRTSESRFAAYVEGLAKALGHADRVAPLKAYCTGLILPGERESVEPMAARVEPGRVQAAHQLLHHFVAKADWSDEGVLGMVRAEVLPTMERQGAIRAWIVDDTGFPKKGVHSVGKQDNCQIAVSLSVANDHASLPVAWRLYLPESWANDRARRVKAGVPENMVFNNKQRSPLIRSERRSWPASQRRGAGRRRLWCRHRFPHRADGDGIELHRWHPVLDQPVAASDGASAAQSRERARQAALSRPTEPRAQARGGQATGADAAREPVAQRHLAGRHQRPAHLRFRPAQRDYRRSTPRPEEWCLIEWPKGESEPTKYWLSNLPQDMALADLVDMAKLRWRIARDYQELKQEIGLGHYEGRGWRGFHHHATLAVAAYGFLVSERSLIPPPQRRALQRSSKHLAYPKVIDPAVPPLRPERHVANSTATIRVKLAHLRVRRLPICPLLPADIYDTVRLVDCPNRPRRPLRPQAGA